VFLNNYVDRNDLLIDWIVDCVPRGSRILDIGANDGSFCPQVNRIAKHANVFAGVDPDLAKLQRNPLLQERYASTLEDSSIPDGSFDCAYAIYVLEHVQHHIAFMKAVARILKPGGSFFFITPNGTHYFAALSGMLARLNIQGAVLRLIRPEQLVSAYHYPALYKLNRAEKLRHLGRSVGFSGFEFRYSEKLEELSCYFPGPFKLLPKVWQTLVRTSGRDWLLGNLMGRMVKA
jgi:ubiquinone/menaquinone biosynthesis C-methylase UbiE